MKLEKYVDKSVKRRKTFLISISVIVLIGVSLLLYKTFASFTESAEFLMMNGKVDYFGNSDIYFAFYKGDKELAEMPQKDNTENLVFDHGECDNGASIVWDNEAWGPIVKNLSNSKTKCSLYFKEQILTELAGAQVPLVESGDGLYTVPHEDLEELGQEWNQTEYRYAGVDPDNYVSFNNEIWRIIGLVNIKTDSGVEQRIKIIRQDGIEGQRDFGNYAWDKYDSDEAYVDYANNWTTSKLKDMLNGIYYESSKGECYTGNNGSTTSENTCDFNTVPELPKGLDDASREMIDKEVIWNIGGSRAYNDVTVEMFYERERGTSTGGINKYPAKWSSATDVGEKYNGIGLIYPSDYGYAVGGEVRNNCLTKNLCDYDGDNCSSNDWLKPNNDLWTITPHSSSSIDAFVIYSSGFVYYGDFDVSTAYGVWPTLYLTTSTKIVDGNGDINSPFVLSVQ